MASQLPNNDALRQQCVTILGCGKLGTALLVGLLAEDQSQSSIAPSEPSISHIHVTVRSTESMKRIECILHPLRASCRPESLAYRVTLYSQSENEDAVRQADVVILGCKPVAARALLGDHCVRRGLLHPRGTKILVSILGGVTIAELKQYLQSDQVNGTTSTPNTLGNYDVLETLHLVRAIPNIAARVRESITVISSSSSIGRSPNNEEAVVGSIFSKLGPIIHLPESQFNQASALAASSLAYYATMISAAAEGMYSDIPDTALSPADALYISAQACRGASTSILSGHHPQHLISEVATKGGSTAAGLAVMRKSSFESTVKETLRECAQATANLSSFRTLNE